MKKTFAAILMVLGSAAAHPALATEADDVGKTCDKPKSNLYSTDDMNKPLRMQMIVDYKALNQGGYGAAARQRGVVSIVTENGTRSTVPVLLSARGNSRRMYCKALPLRMEFLDQSIEKKITTALASENLTDGSDQYLKRYYDLLIKEQIDPNTQVKSQKGNVFAKLGDDVKIVTHCGTADWQYVGGKDEEAQNEKLLSEFYVYQLLATLNLPVETARLATIDYRDADGSKVYDGLRLAFFREPPTSLAKRCGLLSKRPTTLDANAYANQSRASELSAFQANFLDAFAVNNDFGLIGHNMNNLYDENGNMYYGPYDFDLSGIFEPTYFKNQATLEAAFADFMNKLNGYDKELVMPTVKRTLAARKDMQNVIDRAKLSAPRKKLFQQWLDLYMDGLTKFVKAYDN